MDMYDTLRVVEKAAPMVVVIGLALAQHCLFAGSNPDPDMAFTYLCVAAGALCVFLVAKWIPYAVGCHYCDYDDDEDGDHGD
jgi:hypothetical protein